MSIVPRSEVDRCWLSWDRQKPLNRPNAEAVADGFISPSRIVTVDSPLWFPQRGRLGQIDPALQSIEEALQKGLLYAFPFASRDAEGGTLLASTSPGGGTTVAPTSWLDQFGSVQVEGVFNGIGANGGTPKLQLILHLRAAGPVLPLKRAPLVKTGLFLNPSGARQILAVAPIFGRKHVAIQAVSSLFGGPGTTHAVDFHVGLIRGTHRTQALATDPVFEVPAGSALATAIIVPVSFTLNNPCADWVIVCGASAVEGASQGGVTIIAEADRSPATGRRRARPSRQARTGLVRFVLLR